MKLVVLAAKLPPQLDGIGDYSAAMAREWPTEDRVDIFTCTNACTPIDGVGIHNGFEFSDASTIGRALELVRSTQPDWVLVQYNPFSWGRRGFNPWLPLLIHRIRRAGLARVATMVHERYVPLDTWAFRAMSLWQRPQLRAVLRGSDQIFCSTELWVEDLTRRSGGKPVTVSTVGSNIDRVDCTRSEIRHALGISDEELVLGFFGFAHVSKPLHHLKAALDRVRSAGFKARFLYVGGQVDVIRAAVGSEGLIAPGALPAREVSRHFAAMDIHLCPFTDGVSTRRGSMMTGLQHGIATVGTIGESTSPNLAALDGTIFLLSRPAEIDRFSNHVLNLVTDSDYRFRIGMAGQEYYEQVFAFPAVAKQMREALWVASTA